MKIDRVYEELLSSDKEFSYFTTKFNMRQIIPKTYYDVICSWQLESIHTRLGKKVGPGR